MQKISERITKVVAENSRGNKSAFARAINITPAFAAQLCTGQREPSDRTISDICRVFGVSRAWLVDGVGEMYEKRSLNQTLLDLANDLMQDSDEAFRKRFVMAMLQNPPEWWDETERFINRLAEKQEPQGD